MTEIISTHRDGPARARQALEGRVWAGGVVIFPADTLYGLACDPLDAKAIERIQLIKGRDEGKPSAVLFFSPLALRELLSALGPRTREAIGSLLPGPVTMVVHNPERRYPLACREDPERLGVRLIEGPLAGAGCAVFQTSANRSGEPAPRRFEAIEPEIVAGADLAIDGGQLQGEPSTVVDVAALDSDGTWQILREGAMSEAAVRARLEGRG